MEMVPPNLEIQKKLETDGVDNLGIPLGPWRIDAFKWFSSATDANMTILLAKTNKDGAASAFYAPLHRQVKGSNGNIELNSFQVQHLKNKPGINPVPTAELELKGMRAYLIEKKCEGVKETSTLLNITRLQNAIAAVSYWGRGLAISRAYAKVRAVKNTLLMNMPAHAALLGLSEGQESGPTPAARDNIVPQIQQQAQA
ncbi:hypothetical protein PRK78_004451 [Emydomyces testavorans]|uniref:Uncharacterized protein n=1 Tax=Emydomyces testavorans TaxID=2070801 RepID=A0AAF0DIK7_9EURO|nr:hypothetical protein PRK78_004451 [Emydomyces testavorans]